MLTNLGGTKQALPAVAYVMPHGHVFLKDDRLILDSVQNMAWRRTHQLGRRCATLADVQEISARLSGARDVHANALVNVCYVSDEGTLKSIKSLVHELNELEKTSQEKAEVERKRKRDLEREERKIKRTVTAGTESGHASASGAATVKLVPPDASVGPEPSAESTSAGAGGSAPPGGAACEMEGMMTELTFEEQQRERFLRMVFNTSEPPPWTMGDVKSSLALWGVADLRDLTDAQVDKLARVLCQARGEELTAVMLNTYASRIGNALYHLENEARSTISA